MGTGIQRLRRDEHGSRRAYQASKRLMEANEECANAPEEKSAAVKASLAADSRPRASPASAIRRRATSASAQIRAYAAEAELWLAQAEASVSRERQRSEHGRTGIKEGRGKDAKSQHVLAKLDEPISMSFNEDTPLEDVLKYIKQATTTKTYAGIPIYVDPIGLQEAEKSMTSTVRNMDLEGIPLRRTLQLLLKQLDLIYFVEDGMLYITSSGVRRPGELRAGDVGTIPDLAEGRQGRAWRTHVGGDEGADRVLQNPRRDQETGRGDRRAWTGRRTIQQRERRSKAESRTDEQLLKEMRELIQVLKAERQTKNAARASSLFVDGTAGHRFDDDALLHRAASPGSMAPTSRYQRLATAQAIACRNSARHEPVEPAVNEAVRAIRIESPPCDGLVSDLA